MITDATDTHVSSGSIALPRRRAAVRVAALVCWLVPVLGFCVVLALNYAAVTHKRYAHVNGTTGELLPGQRVGQSFVARYPGLSGVEVQVGTYGRGQFPSPASLVFHLRTSPAGPDLATMSIPVGTVLGENAWQLFSFPPIADSKGKSYFVEVESPDANPGAALTLFNWKPAPVGDLYPDGTRHGDGQEVWGDLAFGLRYAPAPWDAWLQLSDAAQDGLPAGTLPALAIVCAAFGLWAMLRLPVLLSDPAERNRWLLRRSLPFALAVAFLNGALYVALVPPWQGPDEFAHFAYAALLDRHGLDIGAVRRLDLRGADRDDELISTINASLERNDYTRLIAGYSTPGGPVDASPVIFQEVRQPPTYYWLAAVAWRVARAAGLPADPYTKPETALFVMRGVTLLLSLGVVALAWVAATLLSPTKHGWLRLALPLTVALLPMRAFADSVANNDVLAELAVSGLFVTLLALFRHPTGRRGVALAALAALLAVSGAAAKSTAIAASIPMLALGLAVWVGMLASRVMRLRQAVAIPLALGLLVAASATLVVAAFEPGETAGWASDRSPTVRPPQVYAGSAHDGRYVFQLDTRGKSAVTHQVMVPLMQHPAMSVTFSGWARLAPHKYARKPPPARVMLMVKEGETQVGLGMAMLYIPGLWVPVTATARLATSAERITLWLASDPSEHPVQMDDLSLEVADLSHPWPDPVFWPSLINPSAEEGSLTLRPWLADLLPAEAVYSVETLMNPQPFDKRALWLRFAGVQFRSFWGNFGWFSVPLPEALYLLAGVAILLAVAGLAQLGGQTLGSWSANEWLSVVSIGALVAAVLVGFSRQMMLTAVAVPAVPQGRYLFVLIIPIAWLLIAGCAATWASLWGSGQRAVALVARPWRRWTVMATRSEQAPRPAVGVWLWLNALLLFAAYCLLALVAPYYHS